MWLRALGTIALWAALASTALAQETQERKDANLLLRMTSPAPAVSIESVNRDDLRELPPPQMDRLSGSTRFHVVVGDKCLPGERWLDPGPAPRRSSRSSRPR